MLKEEISHSFLWCGEPDTNVSFAALPKSSSGHVPVIGVGKLINIPNLESFHREMGINNKIVLWIPRDPSLYLCISYISSEVSWWGCCSLAIADNISIEHLDNSSIYMLDKEVDTGTG